MFFPIRHRAVRSLKSAVAQALYYSGALSAWTRVALRRRAVVLTYHRVLADSQLAQTWSHPGMTVSRRTFESHIRFLKRRFQVLSLSELLGALENDRPFPRPSCLITFDDGWRDTYAEAFPVLREHGMPAVVFLPVGFIGGTKRFWQEELASLLDQAWARRDQDADTRAALTTLLTDHGMPQVLAADALSVRPIIWDVVHALKVDRRDPEPLIAALRAILAAEAGSTTDVDTFMTWSQVREMSRADVAFGGHGSSHRRLTMLTPPEVLEEASTAMDVLTRELGGAIGFSYPNGDWSPSVAAAVKRAGFQVAFGTERGYVAPGDDRFGLRRINIHEDVTRSTPLFLNTLLNLF